MDSLPLLFIGCLAGLSFPMLWIRRRKESSSKPPELGSGDDLLALASGAVVQHAGRDFVVTTAGRLVSAGPWERLVFLEAKDSKSLMLVAARGVPERIWLLSLTPEPLPMPLGAHPAPDYQQLAGIRFRRTARYLSSVTIVGRGEESIRLDAYCGPGARRLLLLQMGGAERGQSYWGDVELESALQVLPAISEGTPEARR